MLAKVSLIATEVIRNATVPLTFQIPEGHVLSTGEKIWVHLLSNYNPWLAVTLISVFMHEFFYFARYIPYMIYDRIPSLRKYKIQPVSYFHLLFLIG